MSKVEIKFKANLEKAKQRAIAARDVGQLQTIQRSNPKLTLHSDSKNDVKSTVHENSYKLEQKAGVDLSNIEIKESIEGKKIDERTELKKREAFKIIHKDSQELVFLAPQQARCLKLLLNSKSSKEIAKVLNLSPRTIDFYLDKLRKKLGCKNRHELILKYCNYI